MATPTAKKSAAKKTAAKKTTAKKTAAKKTTAKKTAAKKTTAKKTAAKKTSAKKTAAKKTTAKKTTAKKTSAKKTAAKTSPAATTDELVHCYRLIFQVDPGGSRKAESFVAGTLAEAQEAAQQDLGSGDGAYHALYYGEQILLQLWEGPTKLRTIDLHPYIEYRIDGFAKPLRFDGPGDAPLLDMDDDDAETTMEAMLGEQLGIEVTIAWDELRLPTLAGRPVRKGESVILEGGRAWKHGFHEHWDMQIRD